MHNNKPALNGSVNSDIIFKDAFTVNPFLRMSFLKGTMGSLFVDGGAAYTYGKIRLYGIYRSDCR